MLKVLTLLNTLLLFSFSSYGDYLGSFTPKDTWPFLVKYRNSQPDTSRVILGIQLSDHYFYRNNRTAIELDSAVFYTTAAQKLATSLAFDKGLAQVYFQQAAIFPLINLREKGKQAVNKAIDLFSRQKNYLMLGESHYRQAGFYSLVEPEIQERIKCFNRSLEAFRKGKHTIKEGSVLLALGEIYFIKGDAGHALSSLKQSLQTFQSVKYERLMGVYDLLGTLYTDLGAPEEGIKYGMLALKTAHALKDSSLEVCTYYNRVGMTHYAIGEYQKARENYENGLKIAIRLNDTESIHMIAANLGNALLRLKKYKEATLFLNGIEKKYVLKDPYGKLWIDRVYISIFRDLKQYDRATKYVNELLAMASGSTPEGDYRGKIYHALIRFYLDKGDYTNATKFVDLHKAVAEKISSPEMVYLNHFWQSTLDSANRKYESALFHFQKYSAIRDSVFNETKSRQISQLEIIYETEKKEENITLLKKESALQQNMLAQASRIQNITYISIALLLTIIGLLIYGYRLIQKNNKNMAARQEEIKNKNISLGRLLTEKDWLVKEIHHRVKNNLHMIVGLLESQSEFLKGDEAKVALVESQYRIQSMSMIHEKLYQTENLTSIEISPYIHELVRYLQDSVDPGTHIAFYLDIEPLEMNISHAIPLGLILNEAITNSIKYAFPGSGHGEITVSLEQYAPNDFTLTIADNGIGLGPDFNKNRSGSLGLTLIRGLCDDIGGRLNIGGDGGTVISIDFSYSVKVDLLMAEPMKL
jgi:two-component sensor histidine kinase